MQEQWFIRFQGNVEGPFTVAELHAMAKRGRFTRIYEVSPDGTTWSRGSKHPELFPVAGSAPPVRESVPEGAAPSPAEAPPGDAPARSAPLTPLPTARPPLKKPAQGSRSVGQAAMAAVRQIDELLRSVGGGTSRALHNTLRAAVVVAPVLLLGAVIWMIWGGGGGGGGNGGGGSGSGSGSSDKGSGGSQQQPPLVTQEELLKLWEIQYRQQQQSLWPKDLGPDFLQVIAKLGPDEDIPVPHRETYVNYLQHGLPGVPQAIQLRRPAEDDARKQSEGMGSMPGMGRKVQWVGIVDWEPSSLERFTSRFVWSAPPTSLQVRLAQEDLWVYQGLLRIIQNVNEGCTRQDHAVVKGIIALEAGRQAGEASAALQNRILVAEQAGPSMGMSGTTPGMPGSMPGSGMYSGPMGASGMGPGVGPGSSAEVLRDFRYVDDRGRPLPASDPQPFAEFRLLPVRMSLTVSQRGIAKVLAQCAECAVPLRITRVAVNPGKGTSGLSSSPYSTGTTAGPGPLGMGITLSSDTAGLGMGSEQLATTDPPDVNLELEGFVYFYERVDPSKLLTGSAEHGEDAVNRVAEHFVGNVRGCLVWLEALRAINACLPKDPVEGRPPEIASRTELHVTSLDFQRMDQVADWFGRIRSQYVAPQGDQAGASGAAAGPGSADADSPRGPGWIVQLKGHHFHNAETAGENQGAPFVRNSLFKNLRAAKILLPKTGEEGARSLSARDLGMSFPVLVDPGRPEDRQVPDRSAAAQPGAMIKLRQFDFDVQWCWQPPPDRDRVRGLLKGLLAKEALPPVEQKWYQHTALWNPPLFERPRKRGTPAVLPLEKPQVAAANGAFANAAGAAMLAAHRTQGQRWVVVTGLLPYAKQKKEYETALEGTSRIDRPVYAYYRVQRAEVTAGQGAPTLPAWEKLDVRRAHSSGARKWRSTGTEVVDAKYLHVGRWPPMAFPLGPLANGTWGPECAHEPEIPFLENAAGAGYAPGLMPGMNDAEGMSSGMGVGGFSPKGAKGGKAAKAGPRSSAAPARAKPLPDVEAPDEPGAGAEGTGPMGAEPGAYPSTMPYPPGMMPPGMPPQGMGMAQEAANVPYQLFRFFDFTVEPGKRYRYRVRLVLANPNFKVNPGDLEDEKQSKIEFLEDAGGNDEKGWSEPTEAVLVPCDTRILVNRVYMPREQQMAVMQPLAKFGIVRFDVETGETLFQEFPHPEMPDKEIPNNVCRGKLANFPGIPKPTARPAAHGGMAAPGMGAMPGMAAAPRAEGPELVDFVTDCLLVDMAGGRTIPGKARLQEPCQILWLDPEGRLVVRNDEDDEEEYEKLKPPEEQAAPAGSRARKPKPGTSATPMPPGYPGMTPGMMPGTPSESGMEMYYEMMSGPKGAKKGKAPKTKSKRSSES